jgi:2-iminobutanoate/2-iminopropanoate deaminase
MAKLLRTFNTLKGPRPIGPYSSVAIYNGMMFVSGQIGIDPNTLDLVSDDVESQAKRALDNFTILLEETNCTINDVIKTTIYLKVFALLRRL